MIGPKIQKRLDELGITQADLARRSGLTTGHVSSLVTGKRGKRLSVGTLYALSKALGVSADFFYLDHSHMGRNEEENHSHRRKVGMGGA